MEEPSRPHDPADGHDSIPPNFGRMLMPHVFTHSGMLTTLSRAYRNPDEAIQHSVQNANMMLADPAISGPLFARQKMTALLNWHIEPEDPDDPRLVAVADELTKVVNRTPRFAEYRRSLQMAVWTGRHANQHKYGFHIDSSGRRSTVIQDWLPVDGDKLVFRYDDGTGEFDPNEVGIRVSPAHVKNDALAGRWQVEYYAHGSAIFLEPWERERICLHKYFVQDSPFEEPDRGGSIHGLGLRNYLYWVWYQKQETLAKMMEMVERSAMGFTIYYYEQGNPTAKEEMRKAAQEQAHTNAILIPRNLDVQSNEIQQIPANVAGIEVLRLMIDDYFGDQITRMILGQTLSTKASATGLGSGLADLHLDSLKQIVKYDAVNLEETLTRELLRPLIKFNYPKYAQHDFWVRIATEAAIPKEELEAIEMAWNMGAKVSASDIFDRIGISLPGDDEEALVNPQIALAQQQLGMNELQMQMALQGPPPGAEQPPEEEPQGEPQQSDKQEDGLKVFGPILNSKSIDSAARDVKLPASDRQREAGNHKKGHTTIHGIPVTIEVAKGQKRRPEWPAMKCHYGYIKKTVGKDGEHVDCFIGPNEESELVCVIDQVTQAGRFDEHKVVIGCISRNSAKELYLSNYPSGWKCGEIRCLTVEAFKWWLDHGDQSKPIKKQKVLYNKAFPLGHPQGHGNPVPAAGPMRHEEGEDRQPWTLKSQDVTGRLPSKVDSLEAWDSYMDAGVKDEELETTGIKEHLLQNDTVSKDDLLGKSFGIGEVIKVNTEKSMKDLMDQERSIRDQAAEALERRENIDSHVNSLEDINRQRRELEKTGGTKFHNYQFPGGENYREVLLTHGGGVSDADQKRYDELNKIVSSVDSTEEQRNSAFEERDKLQERMRSAHESQFTSKHWDEPNVLAHVRMNDRTDVNGKKTLFVEEIQSDWHQKGREKGYRSATPWKTQQEAERFDDLFDRYSSHQEMTDEERTELSEMLDRHHANAEGVPDAPFKKTWPALAMKRAIEEAVSNGHDQVAWTTGDHQSDRYDLSKHVNNIDWVPRSSSPDSPPDGRAVFVEHSGGALTLGVGSDGVVDNVRGPEGSGQFKGSALSDVVGVDLAKQILGEERGNLAGEDLKVGGHGMRSFYDKMLPNITNKLIKKHGGRVGTTQVPGENGSETVWSFEITPSLREAVQKKGQHLFAKGEPERHAEASIPLGQPQLGPRDILNPPEFTAGTSQPGAPPQDMGTLEVPDEPKGWDPLGTENPYDPSKPFSTLFGHHGPGEGPLDHLDDWVGDKGKGAAASAFDSATAGLEKMLGQEPPTSIEQPKPEPVEDLDPGEASDVWDEYHSQTQDENRPESAKPIQDWRPGDENPQVDEAAAKIQDHFSDAGAAAEFVQGMMDAAVGSGFKPSGDPHKDMMGAMHHLMQSGQSTDLMGQVNSFLKGMPPWLVAAGLLAFAWSSGVLGRR